MTRPLDLTAIYKRRGFVLLAELLEGYPVLLEREPPGVTLVPVGGRTIELTLLSAPLPLHGCTVSYYALPPAGPASAEVEHAWLTRLAGPLYAERDQARAEVARLRAENVSLRAALDPALDQRCSCCCRCGTTRPCMSVVTGDACDGACFCGVQDG